MYIRILRQGTHIRRFTVRPSTSSGWEISDEEDSRLLSTRLCSDWHRVEVAMMMFAVEAARLLAAGWVDSI
jgi:hypothetical protein